LKDNYEINEILMDHSVCLMKSCLLRVKGNFLTLEVPPEKFDGFKGSAKIFLGRKGSP
jgi:hypothetical protein